MIEIPHVEEFEMRNAIVEPVQDRAARLGQLQRDLVEVPAQHQNECDEDEADRGVRGGRGKNQGAEQGERNDHRQHDPVQQARLEIVEQRPVMLAAGGERAEEQIKANQRQAAGEPAAEEFSQQELRPRQRLGQQRKQRAILPLGWYLPGRGGDGDDQRANPNEQKADFLEVADDVGVVERS